MNDRKRDFHNSQIFDTNNDHLTRDRIEHFHNIDQSFFIYLNGTSFQASDIFLILFLPLLVALPDFDRRQICRVASIDVLCLKFGHF